MIGLLPQNKKILILAAGVGLVLVLVPFYFAEAIDIADWCGCTGIQSVNPACWLRCLAEAILSLPIRILFAILVGIIGIGALIAGLLYAAVSAIVTWLIQVVLQVGIVPGSNVPGIVEIGWEFSRQFANLFFILALAFIGLATVLKIREYEAKKALPTLIIIALLINFTPVIVGFVVDIGNIVTNFFLEKAGGIKSFGDIMSAAWTYLTTSLPQIFLEDGQFFEKLPEIMGEFLGIVIYGAVLFIFFNVAMFIYLIISMIFLFRTVILWILMILAPIAFLSKVFPDTKTTRMVFPNILHWDKWWETLIQWTIIGIPIAFFLYLSSLIMLDPGSISNIFNTASLEGEMGAAPGYGPDFPGFEAQFISLVSSLLAPVVGLVLLMMGITISIQGAPEGARGFLEVVKSRGQAITRSYGVRGLRAARRDIGRVREAYRFLRTGSAGRRGMTRAEAAKATALLFWRTRGPSAAAITARGKTVVPAGRRAQAARVIAGPIKLTLAVEKAKLRAMKDSAEAGIKAKLGIKETGFRKGGCPVCGNKNVSITATTCPSCGHVF
jgi:hypothetical protein